MGTSEWWILRINCSGGCPAGFLGVLRPTFTAFSGFGIDQGDLLEAREVIATYNLHVPLLSPEPLVGSGERQSLVGRWEPTLL
jgi:hypothetical protein